MKIICPNNRNHSEFSVTAHVTQEWKVNENGEFIESLKECVEVTDEPNARDFIFSCIECGAEGITLGEIVTLYATTHNNENTYINIYDNREDAEKEIGTIIDEQVVTGVRKGYSFKPVGLSHLYDEAPDFCYSIDEARNIASDLGIELV